MHLGMGTGRVLREGYALPDPPGGQVYRETRVPRAVPTGGGTLLPLPLHLRWSGRGPGGG